MTLPAWAYGDPARIVEACELRVRGCAVCERALFIGDRIACESGLTLPACKSDRKRGYKLSAEAAGDE